MITLPYEPWRGGQICGRQIAYGLPYSIFCGEFKKPGSPLCPAHDREMREEHGGALPRFAPGNALGLSLRMSERGWSVYDGWGALVASADKRSDLVKEYGFELKWEPMDTSEDPHGEIPDEPTPEELAAFEAQLKES